MNANLTEVSQVPTARERRGALHLNHVHHHRTQAAEHAKRREGNAKRCHEAAANAHGKLTDGRYDPLAEAAALELSTAANHASYEAKRARPVSPASVKSGAALASALGKLKKQAS